MSRPLACRIMITTSCNYACAYCCNRKPEIISKFKRTTLDAIPLQQYDDISVTGGEIFYPFIPMHAIVQRERILGLLDADQRLFVYTNLEFLPPLSWVRRADGWNIGFHPTQVPVALFAVHVRTLIDRGARNVRVQCEDTECWRLNGVDLAGAEIKERKRDVCDISDKEDWYILTE